MTGKKVTKRTLLGMKQKQEPIAMITAYDYPSARLAEEAGVSRADAARIVSAVKEAVVGL